MSKYNLSWYAYRQDANSGKIEPWNIFEHGSFHRSIIDYLKRFKDESMGANDKLAFRNKVNSDLMYYFWSKAEYEIILKNWIGKDCEIKIDIYDQVMLNFDKFIDYLWGVKK